MIPPNADDHYDSAERQLALGRPVLIVALIRTITTVELDDWGQEDQ